MVFTKVYKAALCLYNLPVNNLKVFYSAWEGYSIPDQITDSGMPIAWVKGDKRIPLIPNVPKEKYLFFCNGSCANCKECWRKSIKNVVFPKH